MCSTQEREFKLTTNAESVLHIYAVRCCKKYFMTIFKLKNNTRELSVCLKSRKHTNHNWYKSTELGGTFAPKTIAHSFGFFVHAS